MCEQDGERCSKRPGALSSSGLTHPGSEGQGEASPQWHQLTGQQLVRIPIAGRQRGVGVIPRLVIVVFDIKAGHL